MLNRSAIIFPIFITMLGTSCKNDNQEQTKGGGGRAKDVKAEGFVVKPEVFEQE